MLFNRALLGRGRLVAGFDAKEQTSLPRFQMYSIALKNAVDTL
jgi:hypothetical protein